jgi:hypothetical protein
MTDKDYVSRTCEMAKFDLLKPKRGSPGILAVDYSQKPGKIIVDAQTWGDARKQIDAYMMKRAERKTNPAKRTGISKIAYVKRPSQVTQSAPSKRLVKRRKANVVGSGRFPNPAPKKGLVRAVSQSAWGPGKRGEYDVYAAGAGVNSNAAEQKLGALLARFPSKAAALEYAQAWATAKNKRVIVTGS